jgi:hypothetical protein
MEEPGYLVKLEDCDVFYNLTFSSGEGTVEINFKTGAVTLNNCTLEQSGIDFWRAVADAYPVFREQVKASNESAPPC